jgi:hypothetical protein
VVSETLVLRKRFHALHEGGRKVAEGSFEELYNLYTSPNVISVVKSRRM